MRNTPIILVAILLAGPAILQRTQSAEPCNVLFLMTDEHHPRILGCYGDPLVQTPTLDWLAAQGVRFTAAYCQNPICVPSRVSLVSGRMPSHLNTFGNTANQTYENITTLADAFVEAGYQAVWFGKTHWGNPRFLDFESQSKKKRAGNSEQASIGRRPQDCRVSNWPMEENAEHVTTEQALAFLDQNRDKKFFLGVSFVKPHFPFTIQQKYYDLYQGKVDLPHAPERLIAELPAVSKQERERYEHATATREEILRARALYYGMVTYVDEEFGRIVKKLDDLGIRDKTIIVYTADHGEMLGERGIWYKNSFYDGAACIPLIWSFPKTLPQGKVIGTPAMNMDIFPTLCDLCNLSEPEGLEGSSLLPVMLGADAGKDRYALAENYRNGFSGRMIRTAKWKYFFYTSGEEYLYDMENDPKEEDNLIADPAYRTTADELRQRASIGWIDKPPSKKANAGKVRD